MLDLYRVIAMEIENMHATIEQTQWGKGRIA
jgi:hypothetical protein